MRSIARASIALAVCAALGCSAVQRPGEPSEPPTEALPAADELWIVVRERARAPAWSADELAAAGLVARDASGGSARVPLAELALEVDVIGRLAAFRVRQAYEAPDLAGGLDTVELELAWPLPAHAAPTDFLLEAGARRIRGIVREREDAERLYAAARRQGRTALLLSSEQGVFRQRIANLPARVPIALTLEGFHDLPWVDGWCELDLALCGTLETRLELDVRVDAGVDVDAFALEGLAAEIERVDASRARLRWSGPSPGAAARLRYRVDATRAQQAWFVAGDAAGASFLLVAYPPLERVGEGGGALAIEWPEAEPASAFVHGAGAPAGPVAVLGRLDAVPGADAAPRCRWSDADTPLAARRVDVSDGPAARALPRACARSELVALREAGLAGLDRQAQEQRLRAFRELALEHGLLTFATALVLVDARSGE